MTHDDRFARRKAGAASLSLLLLILCNKAHAIRPFTLVEDGYPEAVGQLELENTFTGEFNPRSDSGAKVFSVEHEFELGLAENFTLRFKGSYFYQDTADNSGLHFDAVGIEGQVFFTNPNTDDIGLSLITAVEGGEGSLTFVNIFVVQKDFDQWVLAYNLGFETSIDNVFRGRGGASTVSGTLTNALAAAYVLRPGLKIGAEASVDLDYDNWSRHTGTAVYAGPVINWVPDHNWWITAGVNVLLNNTPDEPRWRATLIIGYYF